MTPEKSRDRRSLWIEPGREQLAAFWYNADFKESLSGAKKDPLRKIGSARVQWAADRMHDIPEHRGAHAVRLPIPGHVFRMKTGPDDPL